MSQVSVGPPALWLCKGLVSAQFHLSVSGCGEAKGRQRRLPAGMIQYDRTKWYGLLYLLHTRGTLAFRRARARTPPSRPACPLLLPWRRLLPVIISASAVSALVATNVGGEYDVCKTDMVDALFDHPYAFQLFGIVFGCAQHPTDTQAPL